MREKNKTFSLWNNTLYCMQAWFHLLNTGYEGPNPYKKIDKVMIKHKPHIVLMFMAMNVFFPLCYKLTQGRDFYYACPVHFHNAYIQTTSDTMSHTDLWQSVNRWESVKCLCTNRVAKDKSIRITFYPNKYGEVEQEGKVHTTRISISGYERSL